MNTNLGMAIKQNRHLPKMKVDIKNLYKMPHNSDNIGTCLRCKKALFSNHHFSEDTYNDLHDSLSK